MFMIIAGVFSLGPRTDCHFDITNERGSRAGNVDIAFFYLFVV